MEKAEGREIRQHLKRSGSPLLPQCVWKTQKVSSAEANHEQRKSSAFSSRTDDILVPTDRNTALVSQSSNYRQTNRRHPNFANCGYNNKAYLPSRGAVASQTSNQNQNSCRNLNFANFGHSSEVNLSSRAAIASQSSNHHQNNSQNSSFTSCGNSNETQVPSRHRKSNFFSLKVALSEPSCNSRGEWDDDHLTERSCDSP